MQLHVQEGTVPRNAQNLEKVIDSHPFTHQLDVVLTTTSAERLRAVSALDTSFYRVKTTFSKLFSAFATSSATTAFSVGSRATEDVWCLDTRGVLSLSLTGETYERVGIGIGTSVASPNGRFRFLVKLDLYDTSSLAIRSRHCLERWDIQRAKAGKGDWDVILSHHYMVPADTPAHPSHMPPVPLPVINQNVRPSLLTAVNARVPSHVLPAIESNNAQEDLAELFEWVGLASLGSQRLLTEGSLNSYAASYTPPSGSSVGTIFHFRWIGFLSTAFVQSVVNEVLARSDGTRAISALSFDTPASFISSAGTTHEGENIWTLVVSETERQGSASRDSTNWVLVESRN